MPRRLVPAGMAAWWRASVYPYPAVLYIQSFLGLAAQHHALQVIDLGVCSPHVVFFSEGSVVMPVVVLMVTVSDLLPSCRDDPL